MNELRGLTIAGQTAAAADDVRLALINLLGREERMEPGNADAGTEAFSEYYATLIGTVADLHDPRAAAVLSAPGVIGTGNMAVEGLAALGHAAAGPIVARYQTVTDLPVQTALVHAASLLLSHEADLSAADQAALTALVIKAASSPSPFVRESAMQGLAFSPDPSARILALNIADSDPFTIDADGKTVFPVRSAARRAFVAASVGGYLADTSSAACAQTSRGQEDWSANSRLVTFEYVMLLQTCRKKSQFAVKSLSILGNQPIDLDATLEAAKTIAEAKSYGKVAAAHPAAADSAKP
jgi:hypothetical protein